MCLPVASYCTRALPASPLIVVITNYSRLISIARYIMKFNNLRCDKPYFMLLVYMFIKKEKKNHKWSEMQLTNKYMGANSPVAH